jgi:hypothetical protein
MTTINLELSIEEANLILAGLGELPSKTGAWNVILKIQQQAQPQLPKAEEPKEEKTKAE